MAYSLSQTTQQSGLQYSPSISGGGSSIASPTVQINPTPVDSFANDIDALLGSTLKASKAYFDLSDDATKRVAIDHTIQYEEKKSSIMSDNNLSIMEKKQQLGSLVSDLNSSVADTLLRNERSKEIYDDTFNNKVKVDYAKQMAILDDQQNKIDLNTNLQEFDRYMSNGAKYATMEQAKTILASNLKQQTISEYDIEKSFLNYKSEYANNIRLQDNTMFNKLYSNREAYLKEFVPEFDSLSDASKGIALQGYEKVKNLVQKDLRESSTEFANQLLTTAIESKNIGTLENLTNQLKNNKDNLDSSTYMHTLNTLVSMKTGIAKEANTQVEHNLKSFIANTEDKLKSTDVNILASILSKDDGKGNIVNNDDAFKISANAIKVAYKDDPNTMDMKLRHLEEDYNNAIKLYYTVQNTDTSKPNPYGVDDRIGKAINNKREQDILLSLKNRDTNTASDLISTQNSIPDAIKNSIKQGLSSKRPEDVVNAVNMVNMLSTNGKTRSMLYSDEDIKYPLAVATSALEKNPNLTDADIEAISKISSKQIDSAGNYNKARYIVNNLKISSSEPEYLKLVDEANYFISLGHNDNEVKDLVNTVKKANIYNVGSNNTVMYAPKWATNDVIENISSMIREDKDILKYNPSMSKEQFTFSTDDTSNNILLQVGIGKDKRTLAIFDENSYKTLLDKYNAPARNVKIAEEQYRIDYMKAERNYNMYITNGNKDKANQWKKEMDRLNDSIMKINPTFQRKLEDSNLGRLFTLEQSK